MYDKWQTLELIAKQWILPRLFFKNLLKTIHRFLLRVKMLLKLTYFMTILQLLALPVNVRQVTNTLAYLIMVQLTAVFFITWLSHFDVFWFKVPSFEKSVKMLLKLNYFMTFFHLALPVNVIQVTNTLAYLIMVQLTAVFFWNLVKPFQSFLLQSSIFWKKCQRRLKKLVKLICFKTPLRLLHSALFVCLNWRQLGQSVGKLAHSFPFRKCMGLAYTCGHQFWQLLVLDTSGENVDKVWTE